jgi:hypothetical protein
MKMPVAARAATGIKLKKSIFFETAHQQNTKSAHDRQGH